MWPSHSFVGALWCSENLGHWRSKFDRLIIKLNPNTVYWPWIIKLLWLIDLSADQKLKFTAASGSRKNGILDLQVNSLWNWIWLWRLRLRGEVFRFWHLRSPRATTATTYCTCLITKYRKSSLLLNKVWLIAHDSFMIQFLVILVFLYGYLLKWSFVKTEVFSSRKILQKARWVTSSVWLIPY